MFTGLIQAVAEVRFQGEGRLVVENPFTGRQPEQVQPGESVAVNGACLTATPSGPDLCFDVSGETLRRTSLGTLAENDPVNLERAMRASDRFGGHFVQGHVDTTAEVAAFHQDGNALVLRIQVGDQFDPYLVDKGSIAVSGVSLTIVNPTDGVFEVFVIPHTLETTNLGHLELGDRVNIEFDMIAKHVARLAMRF